MVTSGNLWKGQLIVIPLDIIATGLLDRNRITKFLLPSQSVGHPNGYLRGTFGKDF